MVVVAGGNNGSAPAVPATPTGMVGQGATGGSPREAGTTVAGTTVAPATGAAGRVGVSGGVVGAVVGVVGLGVMWW